ncbi:RuvC-like resolvase [Gordonia phage Commandaria]|uniref:RuvC-like resolvase n=1 Tax=Gordonia phage Commandaria TaxID=3038364 RepID=A0AAF0GKQ5_9CAUD|nr:RuvC-like resolvase [Gordonia phage Commandaria]WGH20841.1 RuvC-like resolvase [Gordonia phage Commandaria]
MRPKQPSKTWLDRKLAMSELDSPFEEKVAKLSDQAIDLYLQRGLSVVAFDPGGTTGWSIMNIDPRKIVDKTVRPHEMVTQWIHGEIDCGARSGQVGNSVIADGYDLGMTETGEAAGVFLMERLIRLGGGVPRTAVVIEDFILRTQTQKRDALSPVRLTAALDQLLWEARMAPTPTKQQPSEAKTTVTDERLKQWGFWDSGSRHARDADRHALLFIRKTREQRSKVFKAWPLLGEAMKRGLLQL